MLCDLLDCTGCQACAQRCPGGCISMMPDAEGFLAPVIDKTRCTKCGLCESVCPPLAESIPVYEARHVYAVKNKDTKIQFASTSGGAFFPLAETVIRSGGAVFGCILDENKYVRHVEVTALDALLPLIGSKYVQSDTDGAFMQAKRRLEEKKSVLFVGTSCQIAGLRLFLKRDYENLYTLEIICKGVPSPALFAAYLQWREKKLGAALTGIQFRTKEVAKWGYSMALRFETARGVRYCPANVDPFFNSFLKSYTIRNCCYNCRYHGKTRVGDFTVSDYWGLDEQHPAFFDTNGVSALMVYTERGERLWEQTREQFDWIETSFESAAEGNQVYLHASVRPPERERAYAGGIYPEMFNENLVFRPTIVDRIFVRLPDAMKKLAKRINKLKKNLHR